MPDTNLVDTEIGVFLLVEKYINDGFYAQIQLYRDWILMRVWRQPEGVFIVIIEFLCSSAIQQKIQMKGMIYNSFNYKTGSNDS